MTDQRLVTTALMSLRAGAAGHVAGLGMSEEQIRADVDRLVDPMLAPRDADREGLDVERLVHALLLVHSWDRYTAVAEARDIARAYAVPSPGLPRLDECPCGHEDNEHVHYCSHETEAGSCPCNLEYARQIGPAGASDE